MLLGTVGLPVFSGARGGLGIIAGPTGGYLAGFLAGATTGAFVRVVARRLPPLAADALAAVTVLLITYAMGWAWLAYGPLMKLGPGAAAMSGIVPFLPLDAVKAAAAVVIAASLRRAGVRTT